MRKLITWATAGLFVLGLQGGALAQKEEKAPAATPPVAETPAPAAKAEQPAAPEKVEKKAQKKTKKKGKKKASKKKAKKAKKKAPVE